MELTVFVSIQLAENVIDIYGININEDSTKSIFNNHSIFNLRAITHDSPE